MTMAQRSLLGTSPVDAYEMATGAAIAEDNIVCLDADGEAVEGSDTAGLKVAGVATRVDEDGNLVYVRDGVVELANSEAAPLTRGHRGLPAYVTGPGEVGNTSDNAICAGVVVDVYDGSVFVDVRPGYAAAAAAGATAGAAAGAGLIAADLADAESTIKAAALSEAESAIAADLADGSSTIKAAALSEAESAIAADLADAESTIKAAALSEAESAIAADLADGSSTIKAAAAALVAAAGNAWLVTAPAAADSTGVKGDIATDGTYLYVCTDTDTWVRASLALATWGD